MMKLILKTAMLCAAGICILSLGGCSTDKSYDLGKIDDGMHLAEEILLPDNVSRTTVLEILASNLSEELGVDRDDLKANWPDIPIYLPQNTETINYILNSELPSGITDKLEDHNTVTLEILINNHIPVNFDIDIEFISSIGKYHRFQTMEIAAGKTGITYVENFSVNDMDVITNLQQIALSFNYMFDGPTTLTPDMEIDITFRIRISGGIPINGDNNDSGTQTTTE